MALEIRKVVSYVEDICREGGREVAAPLRFAAAAAVITSPWAGRGFVEDLRPEILEHAPVLGRLLVDQILKLTDGADAIEAYGKSAICGANVEMQQASAMVHTLHFGNIYRDAVGGKTYLAFTNARGGPGTAITIPVMDKQDAGRRSHYLTIQFSIADAPFPDEIVVALGASTGGHPYPRIGDRYKDMADMGIAG